MHTVVDNSSTILEHQPRRHADFNQLLSTLDEAAEKQWRMPLREKLAESFTLEEEDVDSLIESMRRNLSDGKLFATRTPVTRWSRYGIAYGFCTRYNCPPRRRVDPAICAYRTRPGCRVRIGTAWKRSRDWERSADHVSACGSGAGAGAAGMMARDGVVLAQDRTRDGDGPRHGAPRGAEVGTPEMIFRRYSCRRMKPTRGSYNQPTQDLRPWGNCNSAPAAL